MFSNKKEEVNSYNNIALKQRLRQRERNRIFELIRLRSLALLNVLQDLFGSIENETGNASVWGGGGGVADNLGDVKLY